MRVAPEVLPRLRYAGYFAKIEQIGSPDAAGWIPVAMRFDAPEVACAYVLGFGAQMEVLEPLELRDSVSEAKRLSAQYFSVKL
ncbi:WYL domain-containing protein [Microcoleus sp. FACHB-831]|uniref:WYL domain-containing protein n=1 Tax=Microcoleus sp. FACHB-831 TaxID=2692827 RepID=UPI0018EF524B|nr:WYL domain-containing protein [Microcoleus sp. FACHB-831]